MKQKKTYFAILLLLFFSAAGVLAGVVLKYGARRMNEPAYASGETENCVTDTTDAETVDVFDEPEPEPVPEKEPPHFVLLSDRQYKTGTELSLLDLVYAEDEKGNDLTDRITLLSDGGFDPKTPGTYEVTYSVADDDNATYEETISITIGDFEKNDYGFSFDEDTIKVLIAHDYFDYEPLSEDEAGDIDALTKLTSPSSFGAAYDEGACSCFLYKVTENYLYFFTNKHCPVDSAETLCLYDCNDNMTEIPATKIYYLKYHPEYDPVENGYQQYDQQMFAVPIGYFDVDELLGYRQVHIDRVAFYELAAGDMLLMNTQSWRRCQKDIVLENVIMYTDGCRQTVYRFDGDDRVMSLSHMIVGTLKNSVGSCSGSPCFDKYGNFLGFVWGGTHSNETESVVLDQYVPASYFLEFTDAINFE